MTVTSVEVDTSLKGQSTGLETGLSGIDSIIPDFSGDMIPVASFEDFKGAFANSTAPTSFAFTGKASGTRGDVIEFAKQFLGTPYVWGGTSPKGFDCSGFTQYVLKRFGVNLPRISQQQAGIGPRKAIADLQPGDLVLFPGSQNNGMEGPGHVAIYMGGGQIIEAARKGTNVRIRALGKGENVYGVQLNIPGR